MSYEARPSGQFAFVYFFTWSCHDTLSAKGFVVVIRVLPNLNGTFGLLLFLVLDQLDVCFRHLVSVHL
jgi:hypothetical protein